ncbi:hypothetical protein HZA99_00030 [Candidatus Woesearchaeota archaeon]|nr:hypothetical protein [Candidatus Woesearchaeota archaeon]
MVIKTQDLAAYMFPSIMEVPITPLMKGSGLSYGAAAGVVVTNPDEVKVLDSSKKGIYAATKMRAEDLVVMNDSRIAGLVITDADEACHETVITRGAGKSLVANASLNERAGQFVTIDGTSGKIYEGILDCTTPDIASTSFQQMIQELVKETGIIVRANADTPEQARKARLFGAQGLGPVRTEYMFYTGERLPLMQRFILMRDESCLERLSELQTADFSGIYREMSGFPVGIRLFDPPFNEFCPKTREQREKTAKVLGISKRELEQRIERFSEDNPMLGLRGVSLGILYEEVYKMQLYAAFNGAADAKYKGLNPKPEITVPFVALPKEMKAMRRMIDDVAAEVSRRREMRIPYTVTAMIELPAACYQAEGIAGYVDGFSFGTNDLAQTTYGFSRTDLARMFVEYKERGILEKSPFVALTEPLLEVIRVGVERGRRGNPSLQIGICGEQAGDPSSLRKCYELGMNYGSCSPFRVPFVYQAFQREVQ